MQLARRRIRPAQRLRHITELGEAALEHADVTGQLGELRLFPAPLVRLRCSRSSVATSFLSRATGASSARAGAAAPEPRAHRPAPCRAAGIPGAPTPPPAPHAPLAVERQRALARAIHSFQRGSSRLSASSAARRAASTLFAEVRPGDSPFRGAPCRGEPGAVGSPASRPFTSAATALRTSRTRSCASRRRS